MTREDVARVMVDSLSRDNTIEKTFEMIGGERDDRRRDADRRRARGALATRRTGAPANPTQTNLHPLDDQNQTLRPTSTAKLFA